MTMYPFAMAIDVVAVVVVFVVVAAASLMMGRPPRPPRSSGRSSVCLPTTPRQRPLALEKDSPPPTAIATPTPPRQARFLEM